ncbi:MAG TPA: ATP-binding protein [Candidatus Altiarchaeales archaeon]|nr:ATP-binding protein [Candidatus Altiarchaeales archaeon]HEX55083.1 ATP-binding protein [Candidatus Altiarchaeales archaeon]
MKYFERILLDEIKKWVERREIIIIKGPRQSGKTTLLEMLREWLHKKKKVRDENIIYLNFEDREVLEKFTLDPKNFIKSFIPDKRERYFILIDEAQYCQEIGQKLKFLYDSFKNIKFIVTGSYSLEVTSKTAKFLVGRAFSFELMPFSFYEFLKAKDERMARIFLEKNNEVKKFILEGKNFEFPSPDIFVKDLLKYWEEFLIFGGYPEVIKAESEEEKKIILKNIFSTYLEKDIVSFLQITDTIKFRKLIALLSSQIGSLISYEKLTTSTQGYFKEIIKLLDILQQTYIIKLLRPFHKNLVTELRKNPKIYFIDFGIRNYSINNFNALEIRTDSGKLAENFVLNELSFVRDEFFLNFWRTTAKAEVDFILNNINEIIPIEVKFEEMKREKLGRSLFSFINNYQPKRAIVITKNFWGERKVNKTLIKFIPIVYL